MSNAQVGGVYSQIIQDVIDSSRVDFEEGGVDEHVLEELRMGWQQKLSHINVAAFPWDPKPEPQAISQPPTVPSNAGLGISSAGPSSEPYSHPMSGSAPPQNMNTIGANGNGPRIKSEPGLEPYPPGGIGGATTAQQRAAQHLHQNYGPRAAASINAIQAGVPAQNQGHPQGQGSQPPSMAQMQQMQSMRQAQQQNPGQYGGQGRGMPSQGQGTPAMTQEQFNSQLEYRQRLIATQRLQQQQQTGQNGSVGGAQTDGAGDEDVVIMQNGQPMGRLEIDNMIRERILANGAAMEGGGLMLPLAQASTNACRSRKIPRKSKTGKDQGDANDDDDDDVKEEDEDAINSDLDDPDDVGGDDDDDEDEALGQIMLCMYDKVQRVKNKWKCVMKDGVLTVNGKEYVFHKASGEYEW